MALAVAAGFVKLADAPISARILLGEPLEMGVLLGLATWLIRRRGQGWRDLGLAPPPSLGRVVALAGLGLVAAYAGNGMLTLLVDKALGVPRPNFDLVAKVVGSPSGYSMMLALTWTTVAFGEEMLFRGFLFSRLEALFGRGRPAVAAAWIAQALLFGLLHVYQGVGGVLTTAWAGLVLGAVYLAGRRNLAACILLHGLIDTIGLTAVFYAATHHLKLG